MDLKNIQISDIKEKLQSIDKKTLIKFGIGFGSIIWVENKWLIKII